MPDATVNIGGDASGAIAAVAAAQGAIDGLTGKTVHINIETRGGGAGGGGGGLAPVFSDLDRINTSAERAGRSARGMGDGFERAGGHVSRMGNDAEKLEKHLASVDNLMRSAAADRAAERMGSVAAEAGKAERAVSGTEAGVGRTTAAAGRARDEMGRFTAGAGAATAGVRQMASDTERAGKSVAGTARGLRDVESSAGGASRAVRGIGDGVRGLSGTDLALKGLGDTLRDTTKGFEDVGSTAGGAIGMVGSLTGPLRMAGLVAGVSAIGMGALGAAVAGVGLGGVAEDFMHNNQLMNAGQDAVRGFNKEFTKMRSETTASGMPQMDALGASIKGVGHELAQIGADNMAPTLQHATALAGTLTQTMKQLAPAIAPSEQALTSLAGAALGAFGNSAPEIARFANIVTQNAGGLQSATESIVRGGSALGGGLVQAVSAAAPFLHGAANAAAWGTDAVSGAFGISSNFTDTPGPDGSLPGSTDTGIPDGMGGTVKTPGSSWLARAGTGASKGAIIGGGIGAFLGPEAIPVGGAIGGVVGAGLGIANVPGFTPGTDLTGDLTGGDKPNYGAPQTLKQMGLSSRPSKVGNFGPGSGGPAVPAGPPAADILTQQRADIGLPPVGAPHYSGVGPRGPGNAVGAMPASFAAASGGGGIAPFNNMMQTAQAQVAGGGAQTGQAMVNHIQRAAHVAAPAAEAGGASIGAGINTGMAQGSNSTQSVIDTVTIKHSKHIIDVAKDALGIHSPSTEFDWLGRMTWAGFGQGSERASAGTFGQMGSQMGGVLSAAQMQQQRYASTYDGPAPGTTVSVKKPMSYDDYQANQQAQQDAVDRKRSFGTRQVAYAPGSEGWWAAHDNRAGELQAGREGRQRLAIGGETHDERASRLLQGRADRHEIALSNLGISGHVDPRRDPNSHLNNVNPFAGGPRDPFSKTLSGMPGRFQGMMNQAGQNSALGLSQGMTAHVSKIQAAGAGLASAGHGGYKKKDKQASPSAEWASIAGNSVAGALGAMNAGMPAMAAAGASVAGVMQNAAIGPMSNAGLQIGYVYGENVVTGVQTAIKTDLLQAAGTPTIDNEQARTALGNVGLLGPGAGASVYKNQAASFSTGDMTAAITALAQAISSQQITLQNVIDGQVIDQRVVNLQNALMDEINDAFQGG